MNRVMTAFIVLFFLVSCATISELHDQAGGLKTTSCWKVTSWQNPIPAGGYPTVGNHPNLSAMPCNSISNYNYWVEAGDTGSIFLMVGKNDPYIDYYTTQEADGNGPAGHYFWRLLVIQDGFVSPPLIRTDLIPSLGIPSLTPVLANCPVGPCGWID